MFTSSNQTCVCSAKKSASFFSGAAGVFAADDSIQSCSTEREKLTLVFYFTVTNTHDTWTLNYDTSQAPITSLQLLRNVCFCFWKLLSSSDKVTLHSSFNNSKIWLFAVETRLTTIRQILTSVPYLDSAVLASWRIFSLYIWAARLLYLALVSFVEQPCWRKNAVYGQRRRKNSYLIISTKTRPGSNL